MAGEAARARGASVSAARKLSGSGEPLPNLRPQPPTPARARKTGWGPLGWVGGRPWAIYRARPGGGAAVDLLRRVWGGGVPRDPRARRCFLPPTPPPPLSRGDLAHGGGGGRCSEWSEARHRGGRGPPEVAGDCDTWGSLEAPPPSPGAGTSRAWPAPRMVLSTAWPSSESTANSTKLKSPRCVVVVVYFFPLLSPTL